MTWDSAVCDGAALMQLRGMFMLGAASQHPQDWPFLSLRQQACSREARAQRWYQLSRVHGSGARACAFCWRGWLLEGMGCRGMTGRGRHIESITVGAAEGWSLSLQKLRGRETGGFLIQRLCLRTCLWDVGAR